MGNIYEGCTVLDFTNNAAGPACCGLLSEMGADVIHIEKPVLGDDCRTYLPQIDGVSAQHLYYNNGKKSVVLDLKDPRAIEIVKKMAATADIIVESYRPGVMKRLGLDYESIKAINPKIVYCSISAFGQEGPYSGRAGYDIIGQGMSGIMHMTGDEDGPPRKIGVAIGDYMAALNGFGCIGNAMYYRERTGEGQHVDISLTRGLAWLSSKLDYTTTGKEEHRNGNHHLTLCPYGIFNGNNGESIIIACLSQKLWENLCKVMGREDIINHPDYKDNKSRCDHILPLAAIIEEWIKSQDSMADVVKQLDSVGVPNSKVYTHKDINEDPHFNECGWIAEIPVQDGVEIIEKRRVIGTPFEFSACKPVYDKAPKLGQHNYEVLEKYGLSKEEIDAMESEWEAKVLKK